MGNVNVKFKASIDSASNSTWRDMYHSRYPSGFSLVQEQYQYALSISDLALFVSEYPDEGSGAFALIDRAVQTALLKTDFDLSELEMNWKAACREHCQNRLDLAATWTERDQAVLVHPKLLMCVHHAPRFHYSGSTPLRTVWAERKLAPSFCGGKIGYFEVTKPANEGNYVITVGLAARYGLPAGIRSPFAKLVFLQRRSGSVFCSRLGHRQYHFRWVPQ